MSAALKTASKSETFLHVCGELLTPLPEGALWWPARRLLIVSDLHLEKGSSYASGGQLLPPYDTAATLSVVEGLVRTLAPETVISLGDSFHDRKAEARMSLGDIERVRALTAGCDWVWVEGNHDPVPPAHLGGRGAHVLNMGPLVFRHEPTGEAGEIAGHLHPVARIETRHRTLRRRCFVSDGRCLVMPAMGAFTGGLNVLDPAFAPVFGASTPMVAAVTGDTVTLVAPNRLIEDGPRRGGRWQLDLSPERT